MSRPDESSFKAMVYRLIVEYVQALNSGDSAVLYSRFGVGELVLKEIVESLESYFGQKPDIELAPLGEAFSGRRGSQPFIDLYEMNEPGFWGADCVIWVGGKPQEPTLHVELSKPDDELQVRHRYIGS